MYPASIAPPNITALRSVLPEFPMAQPPEAVFVAPLSQIRYKGQWHGTHIVPASRKYPSSKTCSACNEVNKKLGSVDICICNRCAGPFHVIPSAGKH